MATCSNCGTSIILGGVRDGPYTFCNQKCRQEAYLLAAAQSVPVEVVSQQTRELNAGPCPLCQGSGPVDVYMSHRVHSFLVMTQWQSFSHVCCRKCARKKQLGHAAYSFFLGWWGFPWGLIFTPVQVIRNLTALGTSPPEDAPSPELEKAVRRNLGAQILTQARNNAPSAKPPG